jgi:tRNA (guanine37-N1)-methyltransferase
MDYYVLTLFPEMIQQAAGASILGRAAKNGFIRVETVNIRDFSANKHMRVDDYPYGGGAGMVMEAEPVWRAVRSVEEKLGHRPRVVYLTPQGKVLDQTMVEEFAREEELVLLCGHYEGIDERVLEETVTDYVSIGDYVLTGGELGALVMIDAISRFVPGVLSNEESSQFESLQDNLLEYPHYTRPEIWHDRKVPEVLLSGDHKKIEEWRHQKSLERTELRRPDLLRKSYRVSCVYRGGPETAAAAELLTEKLSRYGTVLDFNRKKLRKQKREFHSRDLLVLVLQDPEEENDSESFRNLHGAGTPCVVVWLNEPEQERHKDLEIFLETRGFRQAGVFFPDCPLSGEEAGRIALEIRKAAEKPAETL